MAQTHSSTRHRHPSGDFGWSDVEGMRQAREKRQYDEGFKRGKRVAKDEQRSKTKERSKRNSAVSSVTKPIRQPIGRGARQGLRQATAPVVSNVAGGVETIALSLAVVGLYVALSSADKVTGVLGAVKRGIDWFADPSRSIPIKGGQ